MRIMKIAALINFIKEPLNKIFSRLQYIDFVLIAMSSKTR